MKENIIVNKSFDFAIRIVNLYKYLCSKKEFILSKQLLRSGTSIGANVNEAINSQSKKEFVAKLNISYKESNETNYWIKLLKETKYIEEKEANSILNDSIEISKILCKIIKSSNNSKF